MMRSISTCLCGAACLLALCAGGVSFAETRNSPSAVSTSKTIYMTAPSQGTNTQKVTSPSINAINPRAIKKLPPSPCKGTVACR